jgi:ribulose 1,5-bisphosphate synthetase/thiazole synthase
LAAKAVVDATGREATVVETLRLAGQGRQKSPGRGRAV